jgi:hypothetical protein
MASVPVIQVLSKADYTEQHLVALPDAQLEQLPVSSVRVKSTLLALTTNNLTYARNGHLFGWWDLHPLPSATPAPFNDATKYGRISAWGFGEVLESNIEDVPKGTLFYGYLPIGTLPVDLRLKVSDQVKDHFIEISAHRSHLFNMYNRYMILPSGEDTNRAETRTGEAWDALMLVFAETAYNLNRFVFPWDGSDINPVHPLGTPELPWSKQSSSLAKSIIIIFAASGKTALSFAHQLSRRPDKESMRVYGVTSESSQKFVKETGFYKGVILYQDFETASDIIKSAVARGECEKIVLCDFGARGDAAKVWLTLLRASPFCTTTEIIWLGIGGAPRPLTHEQIAKAARENAALGRIQVNASGMRDAAMSQVGEKRYFDEFLAAWNDFKVHGGVPGLHFTRKSGMDAIGIAWKEICDGKMKPDEYLLFEL